MSHTAVGSAAAVPGRRLARWVSWRSLLIPRVISICVGALVLAWAVHGLTFLEDEWSVIAARLPASTLRDAYLLPHVQHLFAFDFLLYRAVYAVAGLGRYWPYQLVALLAHLIVVWLLFDVLRRRIGSVLAFFVTLPVLVLGAAWEDLLFPFNEVFIIPMAALLGVMLLLDSGDRRWDVAIFALLMVAVASSTLGPLIAIGVLVWLLLDRGRWRSAWTALVPLFLYGLWYVHYGANAPGPPGYHVTASPLYFVDTAAAAVAGLLGVALKSGWAAPFQLLAVALVVALVIHRRKIGRDLVMLLMILALYWLVLTLNRGFLAAPFTSRYVYPGVVLLILAGAELFRGRSVSPLVQRCVIVVACVSTVINLVSLVHFSNRRRAKAQLVAADVAAVQITEGQNVSPAFKIDPTGVENPLTAFQYFAAVDRLHSSPAPSLAALMAAPEVARAAADRELIRAYNMRLIGLTPAGLRLFAMVDRAPRAVEIDRTAGGTVVRAWRCAVFTPTAPSASIEFTVGPPGVMVRTQPDRTITARLRRFAWAFPTTPIVTVVGRQWLPLPRDGAPQLWHIQLITDGPVQVCD